MKNEIVIWGFGLFISVGIGHLFTRLVVTYYRVTRNVRPVSKEAWVIGVLERTLYTLSIVFKLEFLLGVWLVGKMANRWNPFGIPSGRPKEEVGLINVFLIGNLLSLLFRIVGGGFIRHHLGSP